MKLKRFTLAAVVVLIVGLALTAGYEHLRNRKLAHLQTQSLAAIAASLGRMSTVLNEMEGGAVLREPLATEIRTSVTQLSLVLISNELDIEAMNSDSFAGLCNLIANADKLFPPSSDLSVEVQINKLLNKRLNALKARVRNESSARSSRPGDHHQCALK